MVLVAALVLLAACSLGVLLRKGFAWAARALFGPLGPRDQTRLTAALAAAALWPLVIAAAAHLRAGLSTSARALLIALVGLLPLVIARACAAGGPLRARAILWRALPLTVGLALALALVALVRPWVQLRALLGGAREEPVPCAAPAALYHEVAAVARAALDRHGFPLRRAEPPWWMSLPIRLVRALAGPLLAARLPEAIEYGLSPRLETALMPGGLLLRGPPHLLAPARGVVLEALAGGPALETAAPVAQALEQRIRNLRYQHDRDPLGTPPEAARRRVAVLARALLSAPIQGPDWQALYRQLLQLDRALAGERNLLDAAASDVRHPRRGRW
jgi:hypothetical protein